MVLSCSRACFPSSIRLVQLAHPRDDFNYEFEGLAHPGATLNSFKQFEVVKSLPLTIAIHQVKLHGDGSGGGEEGVLQERRGLREAECRSLIYKVPVCPKRGYILRTFYSR